MRERGLKIALMCLGVAVAAYAGCSDGGTTTGTTTGDSSTSSGNGGGTAATTSAATTSVGSTSAATTGGGAVNYLGYACAANADCGETLKCLTSDLNVAAFGNGGPANGYCSKDCKVDNDCPLSGACVGASSAKAGTCILTCTLGPELTGLDEEQDPDKCNGRTDTRCAPLNNTGTITGCRPTCGRDDECSVGRVCDPRSALCVAKANTGLPMGAKCNPMATTPECAGACVSFGGGVTLCSSPCGLGGAIDPADLTLITDCGGLDKGVCAFSPSGNGAGDYGFCSPACHTQGDCQIPSFGCGNVGLPDSGFCSPAKACPNGAADCKTPEVCTETKEGPLCLDSKYPLGTAAPVGTTSSSGTGSSSSSATGTGAGGASSSSSSATGTGAGGASTSASASTG